MPLSKDNIFFGFGPKLTNEQRVYVNSIIDNMVTVSNSPAGTGKTLFAVATAKFLQMPLYYIVAPVEEDKMGFRKGTQAEKELAYMTPLKDALVKLNENVEQSIYNEESFDNRKTGKAWVYPMTHVFERGINLENGLIFIDEAQNYLRHELKKTLTRVHDSCKVVIAGHTGQCDLKNKKLSGFQDYIDFYATKPYAKICNLTKNFRGVISKDADMIDEFIEKRDMKDS